MRGETMYTLEKWTEAHGWTTVGEYLSPEQAQPVAEDYASRGELVRLVREGVVVVSEYR